MSKIEILIIRIIVYAFVVSVAAGAVARIWLPPYKQWVISAIVMLPVILFGYLIRSDMRRGEFTYASYKDKRLKIAKITNPILFPIIMGVLITVWALIFVAIVVSVIRGLLLDS